MERLSTQGGRLAKRFREGGMRFSVMSSKGLTPGPVTGDVYTCLWLLVPAPS